MTKQPQTTIQQIGLGTIEHWSPELPAQEQSKPSCDYWNDYATEYLASLGIFLSREHNQTYMDKASHAKAVMAAVEDPTELSALEVVHRGSRSNVLSTAIRQWSDGLGNFNARTDAKGTLFKAAGLILQEQIGAWAGNEYTFSTPIRPEEISLGAILRKVGTIPTQGIRYVLLAGELVHKSAWLERDDPEEQTRKLSIAVDIYQRAIKACRFHKLNYSYDSQRAIQMSADIKFYLAQKRFRESSKYGSLGDAKNALGNMRQLIAKEVISLSEYNLTTWPRINKNEKTGNLSERVVPLLLKDAIVNSIESGEVDEREFFSVRSSFIHEDISPPGYGLPKAGFDMVIQRITDDLGVVTTPVQIKHHRPGSIKGVDKEAEKYMPGIITVYSNGMKINDMVLAIGALKKKYTGNGHKDVVKSIGQVNVFRQSLVDDLLAA